MPDIFSILRWVALWVLFVLLICLGGAIAGGILFPVVGLLIGMELSVGEMFRNGLLDGCFLAGIWAPAVSLVSCLMIRQRSKRVSW